jgi:uncharacterized protein
MAGARIHNRSGEVDWQVVKRLWWGSLPVALLTVAVVSLGNPFKRVEWLSGAIGVVILITALNLLLAPRLLAFAKSRRLSDPARFKALQPSLTVLAGATLGVCVALTSVGAGAIGSVMLLYLYPLRMTPHRLVATDLVHAIPLAMVAGMGYLAAGLVDVWMLASLLVGSIPAIVVASLLARKTNARWLRYVLAAVLAIAGVKTLV